ncbi:translation initiation factor IF-2-like [Vidua macroura]|uniref:translation initiation factor IF-2-like n=1 Tax=Vidua macroura TaxID=187451 RepID=UPI0023A7D1F2|nr:translation initiation factor IF-2-like [Vidua macroura]
MAGARDPDAAAPPRMAPRGRCGGRTRMSAHGAAMTPRTSPPKMAPAIRQNRCSVSALTGAPALPTLPPGALRFISPLPGAAPLPQRLQGGGAAGARVRGGGVTRWRRAAMGRGGSKMAPPGARIFLLLLLFLLLAARTRWRRLPGTERSFGRSPALFAQAPPPPPLVPPPGQPRCGAPRWRRWEPAAPRRPKMAAAAGPGCAALRAAPPPLRTCSQPLPADPGRRFPPPLPLVPGRRRRAESREKPARRAGYWRLGAAILDASPTPATKMAPASSRMVALNGCGAHCACATAPVAIAHARFTSILRMRLSRLSRNGFLFKHPNLALFAQFCPSGTQNAPGGGGVGEERRRRSSSARGSG